MHWVGSLYAKRILCISVLRVAWRPSVKVAGRKSVFENRFKAVVPVLVLLFVALWFTLRGNLNFAWCYFVLVFFFQSFEHCDYLAWERES